MIVDEAQNLTEKQLILLCTRLGYGAKIIFAASLEQLDVSESGLPRFL